MEILKKEWPLQRRSFVAVIAVILGAGALGMLLHTLIICLDQTATTWFCMGTLIAMVSLLGYILIARGLGCTLSCQLALAMGQRRRDYALASVVYTAAETAVGYLTVWGLWHLECWINPNLYPSMENEVDFHILFSWQCVLAATVTLTVLSFFIGAIQGRYGRKGLIWFYVLWMFSFLALPRIIDDALDGTASVFGRIGRFVLQLFRGVPTLALLALAAVVLLALMIASVRLMMKQEVKL